MVIATASAETVRHDLKTLPGGYIEYKLLTYGQKLQRRAMVSGLKIQMQDRKKKDSLEGEMNLINEQATIFDFRHCIVDHNLETAVLGTPDPETGEQPTRKLDLTNTNDIRLLDPRVGEEIDSVLSEANNFDEDEEGEE